LPVENFEDAMAIVGYYEKRWLIEICQFDYRSSVGLYLERLAA
jgi:hypothetical protein